MQVLLVVISVCTEMLYQSLALRWEGAGLFAAHLNRWRVKTGEASLSLSRQQQGHVMCHCQLQWGWGKKTMCRRLRLNGQCPWLLPTTREMDLLETDTGQRTAVVSPGDGTGLLQEEYYFCVSLFTVLWFLDTFEDPLAPLSRFFCCCLGGGGMGQWVDTFFACPSLPPTFPSHPVT